MPAFPAVAGTSSDIENAYRGWKPLIAARGEAYEKERVLTQLYDERRPHRPLELYYRLGDPGQSDGTERASNGKRYMLVDESDENLNYLRKIAGGEDECEFGRPMRKARAIAILALLDQFERDEQRVKDEIGLDEAEEIANIAGEDEWQEAERIRKMPISSIRELAFRAIVSKGHGFHTDEAEGLLDRLIELVGINT